MSYHYSRSSGMGGYGAYSSGTTGYSGNGYSSGHMGMGGIAPSGAGTAHEKEPANLSDTELKGSDHPSAGDSASGAPEIADAVTDTHRQAKDMHASIEELKWHLAAHPQLQHMVETAQEHAAAARKHLAHVEKEVKGLIAEKEHPALAQTSSAPMISAHSMGRSRSGYSAGRYSRYGY